MIAFAAVVTFTCTCDALAPFGVTKDGDGIQVTVPGAPEQAKAMDWLNPPIGVTVSV